MDRILRDLTVPGCSPGETTWKTVSGRHRVVYDSSDLEHPESVRGLAEFTFEGGRRMKPHKHPWLVSVLLVFLVTGGGAFAQEEEGDEDTGSGRCLFLIR